MCYNLYLVSPLTLSEVRSMLGDGMVADLLPAEERRPLLALRERAATAARLTVGGCACRLVSDPAVEERVLRSRYRALRYDRGRVIEGLERHRTGRPPRRPTGHWPALLASFVWEHARNAGPTLYFLHFSLDGLPSLEAYSGAVHSADHVREHPGSWLTEDVLTVVTP